jgi:homocysteine S-methyltransferase
MEGIGSVLSSGDEVAILDGGLATELERRGLDLRDPLWSAKILLEAPEAIEAVHFDYFCAGADIGTSVSYQATFEGFAARGIGTKEAELLLRRSVELVARARERFWSEHANRAGRMFPFVAASIGCYGASLHDGSEYRGDYGLSRKELADFHRPRLRVLADSGADLLAFETIPSKLEAEAIVGLLDELPDAPPSWISFSCRNGAEVCHGELLAECVAVAAGAGVAAGINCTPPNFLSSLLRSAQGATVVYPNSGETWDARRQIWTGESSGGIEELAPEWRGLGARVIGGCCRTTPASVAAIREVLQVSRL